MNHDFDIDPDKIPLRRRKVSVPAEQPRQVEEQPRRPVSEQPPRRPDPASAPTEEFTSADPEPQEVRAEEPRGQKRLSRHRRAAMSPADHDADPEQKQTPPRRQKAREAVKAADKAEPKLVRFFYDQRLAIFLGLVCCLLSTVIVIVLLSQIKSGALDQTAIMNMSIDEIVKSGTPVYNIVGPFGAKVGDLLFTKSLGVGAFVIALYLGVLGVRLLRRRRIEFWALTFRSALLAITLSVFVGLLTFTLESPTFWGGVHGHYVNAYLFNFSGWIGCFLVSIILIVAVVSVYLNALLRFYNRWKEIAHARRVAREAAAEKLRQLAILREEEEARLRAELEAEEQQEAEQEEQEQEDDDNTEEVVEEVKVESTEEAPEEELAEETPDSSDDSATEGFVIDVVPEPEKAEPEVVESPKAETVQPEPQKAAEPEVPGFEIDVPVIDIDNSGGDVAAPTEAVMGDYDPRADLSKYQFPSLELLEDRPVRQTIDREEQEKNKDRIIKALADHRITISSIKATVGPTVTLYEIVPSEGIRIAQIKRLEDDIAMSLAAKGIRIIAPMPGKGTVGIEVPNSDPQTVSMRTVLASRKFRESTAKLPVALGATISNEFFIADLASMPHALVAGATGQGKSVGLNAIIASLLYKKHPSELKFVLIDPKMVEFSLYERLQRHFLASLPDEEEAIVTDPSKVLSVLNSLCVEMDNRYALLKKAGTNKIEDYNNKFIKRKLNPEKGHCYLPYIVVIIDEFADLIMTGGKDIENPVMRITQKARAVGIHMVIATQRPSTNVLTGLIKANCPTRIAFKTIQMIDSRTILDRPGAERLIGRGDMLYTQGGDLERMQCAFISTDEVDAICEAISTQVGYPHAYQLPEPLAPGDAGGVAGAIAGGSMDRDTLFDEAARFTVRQGTASTSSLQRRFEIGYNRAGKIMDQMEAAGIVGMASGSKPRQVLVDSDTLETILSQR